MSCAAAAAANANQATQAEGSSQQRERNVIIVALRVDDKKVKILTEPPKSSAKIYEKATKALMKELNRPYAGQAIRGTRRLANGNTIIY
jgi:hypothetical protein